MFLFIDLFLKVFLPKKHLKKEKGIYVISHPATKKMDQISHTRVKNLQDLCKEMQALGYNYVSFEPGNLFKEFLHKRRIPTGNLANFKPAGVYFSKIENETDEDGNIVPDGYCLPSWYIYCMKEYTQGFDPLKTRNLIFAKFYDRQLFDAEEFTKKIINDMNEKQPDSFWQMSEGTQTRIFTEKMKEVTKNFFGLKAESNFGLVHWGCPTICVWDQRCLKEIQCFEPVSPQFEYVEYFITMPMPQYIKPLLKEICRSMSQQGVPDHEIMKEIDELMENEPGRMKYDIPEVNDPKMDPDTRNLLLRLYKRT